MRSVCARRSVEPCSCFFVEMAWLRIVKVEVVDVVVDADGAVVVAMLLLLLRGVVEMFVVVVVVVVATSCSSSSMSIMVGTSPKLLC